MEFSKRTYFCLTLVLMVHSRWPGISGALGLEDASNAGAAAKADADQTSGSLAAEELTPAGGAFFSPKEAIDLDTLSQMDCHLRNVDLCYAGLMGAMQRALPETDHEFEYRCDEMRAAMSCLAVYNERCQTFKVFSALSPFASFDQLMGADSPQALASNLGDPKAPEPLELVLTNERQVNQSEPIRMSDIVGLCDPRRKQTRVNKLLRARLFQLARCINVRMPLLRPCIEDIKVALQVFYEPRRSLPMKPSCCAVSRFRQCAMRALDDVCGLSSFEQLEQTLTSGAGSMMKSLEKVCRGNSLKFDSPYCQEVLPPSGIKVTNQRRGTKASKLARALDLISFVPAAQ